MPKISEVETQYAPNESGAKIIVHRSNKFHTYRYSFDRALMLWKYSKASITIYPEFTLDHTGVNIDLF